MPATLDVSCPNCGKELKVPAEFEGKKVKCKGCQEVFAVKAPGKAAPPGKAPAKAPPKSDPKPEEAKSPFADEDEDEDSGPAKPMGVVQEEDAPRCPHCAKELDPPDAVICVHCGFNNRTRVKSEMKKVVAASATDWLGHLAPGILALVIVIGLVAVDVYCTVHMREWMEGSALELDEKDLSGRKKMIIPPGAFIAFIYTASAGIIIPAARFAFRRLVLDYKPEEKVKK